MKTGKNILSQALRALLSQKLPQREAESLKDEGFEIKNPTRKTALAVAIYKKAAAGDLSALKELRSILNDERADDARKAVIIVDDIGS